MPLGIPETSRPEPLSTVEEATTTATNAKAATNTTSCVGSGLRNAAEPSATQIAAINGFSTCEIVPVWPARDKARSGGLGGAPRSRLGARIVVTDISPVQLQLNAERVGATPFEASVERREILDVCDTSTYRDGEFDAIVAFGGPLSYAFERVDEALAGLFRVVRPGGPVIASVMSLLGTWRFFLAEVIADSERLGPDAVDAMIRSGDVRMAETDPRTHMCQMFHWRDIEDLVARNGGTLLDGAASNFASLGDQAVLTRLEADPDRWSRFMEHEIRATRELGVRDAGTHILFAAQRTQRQCLINWGPVPSEEQRTTMAKLSDDDVPTIEDPEPLDPEDAADIAPLDSEIDFDDEQEEDQLPLDVVEAAEAGVLLDDPETLSDEDE